MVMTDTTKRKGRSNFSRDSYEKNDPRAKAALVQILESKKQILSVESNPDEGTEWKFELPDILAHTETGDIYLEAQISNQWLPENSYPCGRPRKWYGFFCWHRKLNQICYVEINGRGYWCTLRDDLLYAVLCPMDAKEIDRKILKNPRFGKDTNSMPYELAHVLDLDQCYLMNMVTGKMEPFKKSAL